MTSRDFVQNETVWCKGEHCLSPYSGDGRLYRGVITKISRSPVGHVTAIVKYDGYSKEDNEEVDVSKLQKVKVKESPSTPKKDAPPTDTSLFKPLKGSEFLNRMKAKYELDDDEEEEEAALKSERLSGVLFPESSGASSKKSNSQKNKGVVAVGGNIIKGKSRRQTKPKVSDEITSPGSSKRYKLDITGGQAKVIQRKRSPRVSDISSVVDPSQITDAFDKQHRQQDGGDSCDEQNNSLNQSVDETGNGDSTTIKNESKNMTGDGLNKSEKEENQTVQKNYTRPYDEHGHCNKSHLDEDLDSVERKLKPEDNWNSGFEDDDMEKPQFGSTAEGSKIPYLLSEDQETPRVEVPAPLNQYLRDYQREGIQFLYDHYRHNRGAILGDDMGLGKTVQVIGFLSAILGKQGNRVDVMRQKPSFIRQMSDSVLVSTDLIPKDPFLIIGPGCVLYNWLEELETWGYFTVRKYHGSDKKECLADVRKGKVEIVVTTFETYRDHQEALNTINWNAVIVDEVHKIKEIKSQITKALQTICTQRRYGLTGTALQNNLLELWSILDWAQPGCLGSRHNFDAEYVQPIEVGQKHDANKRELALARKKKENFANIRKNMMIRRMKSLIADQLPKKDDNVVFCRLSQLQMSLYRTILEHPSMHLVLHMSDPCSCDSGIVQSKCCFKKSDDGQTVKSLMFTFLHLLLKVSNHVALLIPTAKTSDNQAKHSKKICESALKEHPQFVQQTKEASFKTLSDPKYCGKMKILQGLLKVFSKEHNKVLIFSYSTQVLDIIEQYLMGTGFEYRRIDGSVTAKKRLSVVREFNVDPDIFICLISTKAGGLGLNLTGANKVVIFDPNWNPTHDLQAQDRAYRIGQRRNVNVYRLVSAGTIEENMYLRQVYKQQLLNVTVEDENARRYFYAVQGNPQQKGELFGIKNMFKLRTGDSCLTMDILKRNERVESALSNFDITNYVPPVVHVEEDEEKSQTPGHDDPELADAPSSEEDMFAHFFTSQDLTLDGNDDDLAKQEENIDEGIKTTGLKQEKPSAVVKTMARSTEYKKQQDKRTRDILADSGKGLDKLGKGKKSRTVRFLSPDVKSKVTDRCGKTLPEDSRTGKRPTNRNKKIHVLSDSEEGEEEENVHVDQTLAGTFQDVADVFENCGVVHIHENVKVVGGSRAEDHMTRCAITDVYELHQNSQELAVQCEQMSESEEEEVTPPAGRRNRNSNSNHNTPRSTVVGGAKVLIGQTPKGIKKKQLDNMCRFHKCTSLVDFAALVLGSSLQERIALLNGYYGNQNPSLATVHKLQDQSGSGKTPIHSSKNGRKHQSGKNIEKKTGIKKKPAILGPSISITDSESSLKKEIDDVEVADGSNMEVGCKMKRRKKMPQPSPAKRYFKSQGSKRSKQKGITTARVVVYDNDEDHDEDSSDDEDEHATFEDFADNASESADDLLKRMESVTEDSTDGSNIYDTVDGSHAVQNMFDRTVTGTRGRERYTQVAQRRFQKNENSAKKGSEKTRTVTHKQDSTRRLKTADTSVIDELFGDPETLKKPAPVKHKCKKGADIPKTKRTDPEAFSLVDDLFSSASVSTEEEDDDAEPVLDVSTLKDESIDVFDDPKMWKQRKRKVSEKKNIVDQLIEDSDAEYNSLFTSGKLRKVRRETGQTMEEKHKSNTSASRDQNKEEVEQEQAIGTPSLFSF